MSKKYLVVILLLFFKLILHAETVYLNDGKILTGKIIMKTERLLILDVDNKWQRISASQIKQITADITQPKPEPQSQPNQINNMPPPRTMQAAPQPVPVPQPQLIQPDNVIPAAARPIQTIPQARPQNTRQAILNKPVPKKVQVKKITRKPVSKKPQRNINPTDIKGGMAVGLNYPGFSVRYGLTPNLMIEAKYQSSEGVSLFGPRLYYVFAKTPGTLLTFTGIELDDIASFKGEVSEGSGIAGEIFIGSEYFVGKKLSVQLDFGPAFISLNDKNYSISQAGLEFVVNLGINYYFVSGSK